MSFEDYNEDELKEIRSGYRLGGPKAGGEYDGSFICGPCFGESDKFDDSNINREHVPLDPISCISCGEACISDTV